MKTTQYYPNIYFAYYALFFLLQYIYHHRIINYYHGLQYSVVDSLKRIRSKVIETLLATNRYIGGRQLLLLQNVNDIIFLLPLPPLHSTFCYTIIIVLLLLLLFIASFYVLL
jgi:hypothetical protein